MTETLTTSTDIIAVTSIRVVALDEDPPAKSWDDFEACEQCRGHAQIDETPDGDLVCHVCGCKFPRPSS